MDGEGISPNTFLGEIILAMSKHCLDCTCRMLGRDVREDDVVLSLTEYVCDLCFEFKLFVLEIKEEALPFPEAGY